MSIKCKILSLFLGYVAFSDMSFGQGTLKIVNRASSQNLCLQVSPSGTAADGICINGSSKVADFPAGLTLNSGTTLGSFVEGTFTPTVSSTTNITATASIGFNYQRIGNQVHVFGGMDINCTAGNTFSQFSLTVPINAVSSITDNRARGTGGEGDSGTIGVAWMVRGSNTNNTVIVQGYCRNTGLKNNSFHYTYWVN